MVYIYYLQKNEIPFYIGKAVDIKRRLNKHKMNKGENISLIVIDEVSEDTWRFWESYWICQFKCWGFILDNKNNGGGGITSWDEIQKKSHSILYDKDLINKIITPERNKKISNTLKQRNHSQYYTLDIRHKMSNSMRGTHLGPFTDKHIDNLKVSKRKTSKRILQYDLNGKYIQEWKSKGEAHEYICSIEPRAIGQNVPSQIKDCCLGRMISCWGFIWRFKDEFIPLIPKYYPIEQYQNGVLINTFYNELEAEEYIIKNNLSKNKQLPRNLIKKSIKKQTKYLEYEWKYKK
jgi:hypothetical protein